jgi:hypothetical protein
LINEMSSYETSHVGCGHASSEKSLVSAVSQKPCRSHIGPWSNEVHAGSPAGVGNPRVLNSTCGDNTVTTKKLSGWSLYLESKGHVESGTYFAAETEAGLKRSVLEFPAATAK